MTTVPESLCEGIRKAEIEHVVDRPLSEVMVDPEDGRFLTPTW
jgi:hypothetical protein